jgi:hypothetical protein
MGGESGSGICCGSREKFDKFRFLNVKIRSVIFVTVKYLFLIHIMKFQKVLQLLYSTGSYLHFQKHLPHHSYMALFKCRTRTRKIWMRYRTLQKIIPNLEHYRYLRLDD